jgi:soluble cytochrome b562|tara:strand:+ start:6144 stop:6449 length:306 start_codon:yes stop_codon:yes gene_type:complete
MKAKKPISNLDEKDPTLSKEELNARRDEITDFYKDNIKHLEIQAEYEMLLSTIEKARAERMQAQMFMAQQYADQKEGGVAADSEEAIAFKEAMENAANNIA